MTGFPGGTAVSLLQVYDWPAADGRLGGSPHVHLACTEAYVVTEGEGAVQTLTARDGLTETPLRRGSVVWFSPGTIHRALTADGSLRAVVVMQNSGLPEAGDAVLTFPPEVLADEGEYEAAVAAGGGAEPALRRRDLAVRGFLDLAARVGHGDTGALTGFYRQAVALRAGRLAEWERVWRSGAQVATDRTGEHLAALREGRVDHLLDADVQAREAPGADERRYGMCGRLSTYDLGGA